jgi:hypothetical protein
MTDDGDDDERRIDPRVVAAVYIEVADRMDAASGATPLSRRLRLFAEALSRDHGDLPTDYVISPSDRHEIEQSLYDEAIATETKRRGGHWDPRPHRKEKWEENLSAGMGLLFLLLLAAGFTKGCLW